jgi:hypothetical protein
MSVLRLSAGGVSFRHRSCVAGHGPGIRVVTVRKRRIVTAIVGNILTLLFSIVVREVDSAGYFEVKQPKKQGFI